MSFNPPPEDTETCAQCYNSVVWGDVVEYRGDFFCESCMEEIDADNMRDMQKDERLEKQYD